MKYISICCVICVLGFSCTKIDIPDPKEEEPTFFFQFEEESGFPVDLAAGQEDYFMYTSHEQDANGVYTFSGELRSRQCANDCRNAISFHIRNTERTSPQSAIEIDRALQAGKREYYLDPRYHDSVDIILSPSPTTTVSDAVFGWETLNASRVEGPQFRFRMPKDGHQRVYMIANLGDRSCQAVAWQEVTLDTSRRCRSVIAVETTDRANVLHAKAEGHAPFSYEWSSGETSDAIKVPVNSPLNHMVTVTDALGCKSGYSIKWDQSANVQRCPTVNFVIREVIPVRRVNELQFGKVMIQFVNRNGRIFNSSYAPQEAGSFFAIEEVSDFQDNDRGDGTKMLRVMVKVKLFSPEGRFIEIDGARGTIAVAYPKR